MGTQVKKLGNHCFNSITVRLYTTCCKINTLCIFSAEYIVVFGTLLTINSDCFSKEHRILVKG
jgi:hypothetical protein